jgi:hypothetical protein|tara:strand:+ start:633 stop:896 length:264 start_codon:yes stop_codon:yes gene_type:complete
MYYFWKMMGYSEEDLTYFTTAELQAKLKELDTERQKQLEAVVKTRSGKKQLETRFYDDAMSIIKDKKGLDEIRARWRNVKGLDNELD